MVNKRGIELDMLGWWIIAVIVLVLMVLAYFFLRQSGLGLIEHIKNLFSFGG